MYIRDAHNRHTRALVLQGALIHYDTHQKHAHRKTDDGNRQPQFTTNLARVFTESAARCHFQCHHDGRRAEMLPD